MTDSKPSVKELREFSSEKLVSFLGPIYEKSVWVAEALVSDASLSSVNTVSELATLMKAVVDNSPREKKMNLLLSHPDLCHKISEASSLTEESKDEQSRAGLQSLTPAENERFQSLNSAYREKFSFPFILAVRNATKYTVLSALEGRSKNSVEQEFSQALSQVHKIAWMRLLQKIDTSDAKGFLTCHVLDTANGCPGKSCGSVLFFLVSTPPLTCTLSLLFIHSRKDENPSSTIVPKGIF